MQIRIHRDAQDALAVSALVLPVFADANFDGATQRWDALLDGALRELIASEEITGKIGDVALLHHKDGKVRRILAVGLGERTAFAPMELAKYAGSAVRYLGKRGVKQIAFALPLEAHRHTRDAASFIIEGALVGTMDTTTYRSEQEKPIVLEEIVLLSSANGDRFDERALQSGAERGRVLGEAVNFARTLALTPANDMTPTLLAKQAEEAAKRYGLAYDVLDEERMAQLGMGALLGVSRGSDEPARLIVLRYDGDASSSERIAFVGKGLTFDSGGISIKPAENMHEMKYDMSGGAGVIAALSAVAQLKPKLNVLGLVPSSENLPGSRAVKPGDIVRAMNGKTIEVINTDAEGRLILADALCYARELGATRIVDCATLTGACVVALGHAASAAFSNDDTFLQRFLPTANATGERYWHMPLYDDYKKAVKSEIADLRNSTGRPGGSCTAAAFLSNFVGEAPWIHLDIAGTAYMDDPGPGMVKGPTGTPVRALVTFAEHLAGAAVHPNGPVTEHDALATAS
ncbi:MAG: leucyl aminopeptidase [Candidatus Eremiobacteraeota bacterium]|nr:leucyl aminopeptidase [Candidatus Eremiobacteraeota bacterium]